MNVTYIAVIDAADPNDIATCPNPNVTVTPIAYNQVRLIGEYEELVSVLTSFIGMTGAEADCNVQEL